MGKRQVRVRERETLQPSACFETEEGDLKPLEQTNLSILFYFYFSFFLYVKTL
jgi:hypothetical protein